MVMTEIILLGAVVVVATQATESGGCTADGKTFKDGEQNDVAGYCEGNVCMDGKWLQSSCGVVGLPYKWVFIPENTSKPYPECCGRAVPPLDIVPDVLDKLQFSEQLNITYEGGHTVDMGNELTPTQVKNEPVVSYQADATTYYLLCMTDPDAPSRQNPTRREFRHWLVGNIPGSDVSRGQVLTEYVGSGPPQGTGLHRYVFLLYKQPGQLTFDEPRVTRTSAAGRGNFSIRKFAAKYKLGDPVAINVYQAQYDDYVPQVHKQLGF